VKNVFARTINYLKTSHDSPDVKSTKVIYGEEYNTSDSYDAFGVEPGFEKEVERFNRMKL